MHKVKLNLIVYFRYTTPTHESTKPQHKIIQAVSALGLGTQKFPTKHIKRSPFDFIWYKVGWYFFV